MKKLLNNKSLYLSWLSSYFILIIIFVLMAGGIITIARVNLKKETSNVNSLLFETMCSNIDAIKDDVNNLSSKIGADSNLRRLLDSNLDDGQVDYYWISSTLNQKAAELITSYNYIEELVVYDSMRDKIQIGGGILNARYEYKNHLMDVSGDSYEEWKEFMNERHAQELYRARDGRIAYLHNVWTPEQSVVIIIYLRVQKFEDTINAKGLYNNSNFVMLNSKFQPVFSAKGDNYMDILHQLEESGGEQAELTLNNEKLIYYTSDFDEKEKYIFIMPQSMFYRSNNAVYYMLLCLLILFVTIAIWISVYFLRKNYNPIKKILHLIASEQTLNAKNKNELALIEDGIKNAYANESRHNLIRQKYNKIYFDRAVIKSLSQTGVYSGVSEVLDSYDAAMDYRSFVLAIISVYNIDDELWEQNNDKEDELIETAVSNIYGEILGDDFGCLTITIEENLYGCIIGSSRVSGVEIAKQVKTRLETAQKLTNEYAGISYCAYISEATESLDNLKTAYTQTMELFKGDYERNAGIVSAGELSKNNPEYFSERARCDKLAAAVKTSNFETIRNEIEEMFMQMKEYGSTAKNVYIKRIVAAVFDETAKNLEMDMSEAYQLLDKVNLSDNAKSLRAAAVELMEKIASCKPTAQAATVKNIVKDAMEYIEENYHDVNMNVNSIAQNFNISSGHLSKIFKNQNGEILKDYIARVRLRHSEILLSTTDDKIDNIATSCGFTDSHTYRRTFKRYYGVTPGQYRSEVKQS